MYWLRQRLRAFAFQEEMAFQLLLGLPCCHSSPTTLLALRYLLQAVRPSAGWVAALEFPFVCSVGLVWAFIFFPKPSGISLSYKLLGAPSY